MDILIYHRQTTRDKFIFVSRSVFQILSSKLINSIMWTKKEIILCVATLQITQFPMNIFLPYLRKMISGKTYSCLGIKFLPTYVFFLHELICCGFADTSAYDSLVANQKELKKAQLVDDLNEKLFNRPGVFELVEKNILPADDTVTEALKGLFFLLDLIIAGDNCVHHVLCFNIGGNITYKKTTADFEEDSSDAFSPEQPASKIGRAHV